MKSKLPLLFISNKKLPPKVLRGKGILETSLIVLVAVPLFKQQSLSLSSFKLQASTGFCYSSFLTKSRYLDLTEPFLLRKFDSKM
ncbi:MAG: hypothetical protein AB8E15_11645 [Bdellovibrionales bacterium]